MANGKFVSYLRVSTARQGASGLGLEAQRAAVAGYLNGGDWALVREVVEVESGKRNDRPALDEALRLCRRQRATLVIAKLDRLARNVYFIAKLMEDKVPFVAVDMPSANDLTVHILAAVAQDEAKRISDRTKAALAAAKTRGTVLGGLRMSHEAFAAQAGLARAAGVVVRAARATKFRDDILPVIAELQEQGMRTLRSIADELNKRGEQAPRGGKWSATQVHRVLTDTGAVASERAEKTYRGAAPVCQE